MSHPGESTRISPGQYFWMTMAVTVAGGIYLWPHGVLKEAGTDAPYSILLAWMLALILAWAAHSPPAAPPHRGVLAGVATAVVVGEFLVTLTVSVLLFALMLQAYYLPKTPVKVTATVMVGISVWLATRPLEGLARTTQFWFPLVIASVWIIAAFIFFQAPWPRAALPAPQIALKPTLEGALTTWYLWMSGNVFRFFAQYLRDPGQARRLTTMAFGVQGVMVLLIYALVLSTVGPYAGSRLHWPIVYIADTIRLPTFIVNSLGMVMVMTWTTAFLLYLAVHLWCMGAQIRTHAGGSSRVHTIIIPALGAVILGAVFCAPWPNWPLPAILVNWLGPIDLARLGLLALPMGILRYLAGGRKQGGG